MRRNDDTTLRSGPLRRAVRGPASRLTIAAAMLLVAWGITGRACWSQPRHAPSVHGQGAYEQGAYAFQPPIAAPMQQPGGFNMYPPAGAPPLPGGIEPVPQDWGPFAPVTAIPACAGCARLMTGVDCQDCAGPGELHWSARRPIPWQVFAQGEYIGPHRTPHVPAYRLRADDQLEFVYRFTHEESAVPYRFGVGDELIIESLTDATLNRGDLVQGRGLAVQPDGTITLPLLGPIPVARRTVEEIRRDLEDRYERYYKEPSITVTPLKTNTKLEDLRDSVDGRFGAGGQRRDNTVTPEGTIQLPGIGSVPAQGLTLEELEREIEERYVSSVGPGVEVTPVLSARAATYVFVLGEVTAPGRYQLLRPTTVMGTIALAGGREIGGNVREVVVFRRTADWRLIATKLDLQGALLGKRPCPADEIWVRDADIVLVPKSPLKRANDAFELLFTNGLYAIAPFRDITRWASGSVLGN